MIKMLIFIMLFAIFVHAKSVEVEVSGVKIRKIGIEENIVYTITGSVEYNNWDSCVTDLAEHTYYIVCIVSNEEISSSDFKKEYNYGESVICGGQKISQNIRDEKNSIKEAKYYGCAICASEKVISYQIYEVWKFPVWGIVSTVIVILIFIALISYLLYYRYNHSYKIEFKENIQVTLLNEEDKNAVINYGSYDNKEDNNVNLTEIVENVEQTEKDSESLYFVVCLYYKY